MSKELIPSRNTLAEFERLLMRFQFECEDAGVWPGAHTLPELRHFTGAPDTLAELHWLLEELTPTDGLGTSQEWQDGTKVTIRIDDIHRLNNPRRPRLSGWPTSWRFEVLHVLENIGIAVRHLVNHWGRAFGTGDDALSPDAEGQVYWLDDAVVTQVSLIPPISEEVAAVIERCARRLRVILADGPTEPEGAFVPTERQESILAALDGCSSNLYPLAKQLAHSKDTILKEMKDLRARGKVVHDAKLGGYYRPDAPPK